MRLEIEIKKLQKDLQKKISMKEPAGQKLIAQKIIKTQKMIDKTDKLDAQLQTVIFEYFCSYLDWSQRAPTRPIKRLCSKQPIS